MLRAAGQQNEHFLRDHLRRKCRVETCVKRVKRNEELKRRLLRQKTSMEVEGCLLRAYESTKVQSKPAVPIVDRGSALEGV